MSPPATRLRQIVQASIGLSAVAGLCAALSGCDGRFLPEPNPGQSAKVGRVYTVTSGSAFNLSIGMTQAEADRVLDTGGAFKTKYRKCVTPSSLTPTSNIMVAGHITNFHPPSSGCGADDLVEMRRADAFMQSACEDHFLDVRDGRIIKIGWARLVGYIA
jgi:hypothetical protein